MEVTEKNLYVHKYFAHEMTSEEEIEYMKWLNANEEHLMIHDQIDRILKQPAISHKVVFDKDAAFMKHLSILKSEGEIVDKPTFEVLKNDNHSNQLPTQSKSTRVISLRWMSAIAACMVLAIGAWFLVNNETITQTYESNSSATTASLSDGSKVFLNQGSKLDVYTFGNTRKVALKGEAFFDISSNKEKPFIISTGEAEVKVLGTQFTVSTIDKTVNVKEGKVEVTFGGESRILTANQKLSYAGGAIDEPSTSTFDDSKLWFNNDLSFNNAPFDKVVDDISKHFNINLELPKNRDWAGCTFTSNSLKGEKFENILIILQVTYELQYQKVNDNTYKLSKVRCK